MAPTEINIGHMTIREDRSGLLMAVLTQADLSGVDWQRIADISGYKNPKSAKDAVTHAKNKWLAELAAAEAAQAIAAGGAAAANTTTTTATTTTAAAATNTTSGAAAAVATSGEDGEEEETN